MINQLTTDQNAMQNNFRPPRTYWAKPTQLLAGDYPGEVDEKSSMSKLKRLLEAGVSYFIDLTEEGEFHAYAHLLCRLQSKTEQPIEYHRFPIRDLSVPHDLAHMTSILESIDLAIGRGHVVYVHCGGGVGRTGTVIGCWYSRYGQGGQAALDKLAEVWETNREVAAKRPISPQTNIQRQFVIDWVNPHL